LRLGEIDTDRSRASFEPRLKQSPFVRYYARPPLADVAALLTYVAECGSDLTADQYEVAAGV
jgi:hypothetical protein